MQAQTIRRLRGYRVERIILGVVIALGMVAASLFIIQVLTDGQPAMDEQERAPVSVIQEDPPLPAGWVDSYFSRQQGEIPAATRIDPFERSVEELWFSDFEAQLSGDVPDVFDEATGLSRVELEHVGGSIAAGRSVEDFRFAVTHSADTAEELTLWDEIRFQEDNIWDYGARAETAALPAPALSQAQIRFLEENIWNLPRLSPQFSSQGEGYRMNGPH